MSQYAPAQSPNSRPERRASPAETLIEHLGLKTRTTAEERDRYLPRTSKPAATIVLTAREARKVHQPVRPERDLNAA